MNHAERAYLALTSSSRALASYRAGQHTMDRAAAHMMLVGEHVADVSYWSREAVDDGQMTEEEAVRIMRVAAANAADMSRILVDSCRHGLRPARRGVRLVDRAVVGG